MKYEVLTYGHEALRRQSIPVESITAEIRQLARDMLTTMYGRNGLGLAAEQIGRTEAICVIDVPEDCDRESKDGPRQNPDVEMPLILVNPEITEMVGKYTAQEGCLSFPDIYINLRRAQEVAVTYTNLEGKRAAVRAVGLLSRAIQHELDHLHGKLLVDRMSAVQKVAVAGKLKRLKKKSKAS